MGGVSCAPAWMEQKPAATAALNGTVFPVLETF